MTTMNMFNCFTSDVGLGKHVIGTSVFKCMLSDTAPVATNTIKTNITEIAAGNGYVSGGMSTTVSQTNVSGLTTWLASDPTFTATGAIPTFRYLVLYNSTNNALIGWVDMGLEIGPMADNDTYTHDFDQTNGALQISIA